MGIYTSNRYFGEAYDYASEIPMNEAYDAAFGCAHILADCQRNDMAIFESSIYSDMEEVKIPIPDIKIQEAIANIYSVYMTRKRLNEQLKTQIKDICPILIRGSLEEI